MIFSMKNMVILYIIRFMKGYNIMERLMEFFKIMSDETRLRTMMLLNNEKLCVCEICEILDISQPKISRHLAKLRDMGFVIDKRQGQWIFYELNLYDDAMKNILDDIDKNIDKYPNIKRDRYKLDKNIKSYYEIRYR